MDEQLTDDVSSVTSRVPNAKSWRSGLAAHQQREFFQQSPEDTAKFLAVGDQPYDEHLDAVELAAMTVVAEALLSYDETITKR